MKQIVLVLRDNLFLLQISIVRLKSYYEDTETYISEIVQLGERKKESVCIDGISNRRQSILCYLFAKVY